MARAQWARHGLAALFERRVRKRAVRCQSRKDRHLARKVPTAMGVGSSPITRRPFLWCRRSLRLPPHPNGRAHATSRATSPGREKRIYHVPAEILCADAYLDRQRRAVVLLGAGSQGSRLASLTAVAPPLSALNVQDQSAQRPPREEERRASYRWSTIGRM